MFKTFYSISLICILLSIFLWIPNIFLGIANPYVMLTFFLGIIGLLFSLKIKQKYLIIGNIFSSLSFFLLMFLGYIFELVSFLLKYLNII